MYEPPNYEQRRRGFSVAFAAGLVVMLFVLGGGYFIARRTAADPSNAPRRLPLGTAEQAYAEKIHFLDLRMSRAANMLNQEVTYLDGLLSNDGDRTIRDLEVTVEFRDAMNQVVLRTTHRLLGPRPKPVDPLRRREFQITFEHVPEDWNRQYPSIRVTGLVLD